MYYSPPPGILIKGLTIALLLSQIDSGSQNPQKHVLHHCILMMRHADSGKKWFIENTKIYLTK